MSAMGELTVEFQLNGQTFTALNGGPAFKFNEAISLQVHCKSQNEVDYYWEKLSKGAVGSCFDLIKTKAHLTKNSYSESQTILAA